MLTHDKNGGLERLFAEVIQAGVHRFDEAGNSAKNTEQVAALGCRNYGLALDRFFSRRELHSLLKGLRLFLPRLNREQFRWGGLQDLELRASELGARLVATPFAEGDGRGLLGFYSSDGIASKPLIYVNSVHHPAALSAAFFHEIGHHLAARLLDRQRESLNYAFRTEYDKHLDEPEELLADLVVCLEAYPKRVARHIFSSGSASVCEGRLSTHLLARARDHLVGLGFLIDNAVLASEGKHYLSGMVHFLKLRAALFSRFDL